MWLSVRKHEGAYNYLTAESYLQSPFQLQLRIVMYVLLLLLCMIVVPDRTEDVPVAVGISCGCSVTGYPTFGTQGMTMLGPRLNNWTKGKQ